MSLAHYNQKRDFTKTREPRPPRSKSLGNRRYVIQKHDASNLHYDLRLEINGVLKSWAVPLGIPFRKSEKRLAIAVEDHPIAYIDFEGVIPQGQYGGGTVLVWDKGLYQPGPGGAAAAYRSGKIKLMLEGEKLVGTWHLLRTRQTNHWLLIKTGDGMKPIAKSADNVSAKSGLTMKQLANARAFSKPRKINQSKPHADKAKRSKQIRAKHAQALFIPPMLSKSLKTVPVGDWFYEIKWDGYRALLLKEGNQIRLLSRNQKELGSKFPEIIHAGKQLHADVAIIDGEITAMDKQGRPSFQLLQTHEAADERPEIIFFAFDLLALEGQNLCRETIEERKSKLQKIIPSLGSIRFSPALGTDGTLILKTMQIYGLEGVIGKRVGSAYEPGMRSGTWVKIKVNMEQEVVIGGYTDPKGTRPHLGSLLTGVYRAGKLRFCGKVGTGFDDRLLKKLITKMKAIESDRCPFANLPEKHLGRYGQGITRAEMKHCHWVQPRMVCQVRFAEWTQDQKMRQPVFVGLRHDKEPLAVVREIP